MPKKSKREKILADIRRRVRTEHVFTTHTAPSPIQDHAKTFQFTASGEPKRPERITTNDTELIAIKKDLTKTVVLAAIAIGAELALFWFGKGKI